MLHRHMLKASPGRIMAILCTGTSLEIGEGDQGFEQGLISQSAIWSAACRRKISRDGIRSICVGTDQHQALGAVFMQLHNVFYKKAFVP